MDKRPVLKGEVVIFGKPFSTKRASVARREGLGVAWGLVNGIIFTLGIWLALTGLVLLILR